MGLANVEVLSRPESLSGSNGCLFAKTAGAVGQTLAAHPDIAIATNEAPLYNMCY